MNLGWPFKSNVCVLYVSNGRQLGINMPGQRSIQATSMWSNFHHFHDNYSPTLLKMWCLILDVFFQPDISYSMLCLLISFTCQLRQPQSTPHASWLTDLGLFNYDYFQLKWNNRKLHNKRTEQSPDGAGLQIWKHLGRGFLQTSATATSHHLWFRYVHLNSLGNRGKENNMKHIWVSAF